MTLNRISINPARMIRQPCIRDLRLTVRRVLEILSIYPDRDELRREYPKLDNEDIRQALEFAVTSFPNPQVITGRSVIFIEVKRIDSPLEGRKQQKLGWGVPLFQ